MLTLRPQALLHLLRRQAARHMMPGLLGCLKLGRGAWPCQQEGLGACNSSQLCTRG